MKNENVQTRLGKHPIIALEEKYQRLESEGRLTERKEDLLIRRTEQVSRKATVRHRSLLEKKKYMPTGIVGDFRQETPHE